MLQRRGFTLIEILIVISILAILTLASITMLSGNRDKADDAKAKSDLDRLKISFEEYYNDKNCYPPATWLDDASDCGSDNLKPYLNTISCDRRTGLPYIYRTDPTGCVSFALYAKITNTGDPQYSSFMENSTLLGTYAVSSSNVNLYPSASSNPNNRYYCQALNNCSSIPTGKTCTPSWPTGNCDGDITSRCTGVLGTCSN